MASFLTGTLEIAAPLAIIPPTIIINCSFSFCGLCEVFEQKGVTFGLLPSVRAPHMAVRQNW
jgi:hypothetical protein